jgi:hypothetical protein
MACTEEPQLIAKIIGHVRRCAEWTGSAAPKPTDVGIGREMSTLTAQPCIGLINGPVAMRLSASHVLKHSGSNHCLFGILTNQMKDRVLALSCR